jgi:hypothetical protein
MDRINSSDTTRIYILKGYEPWENSWNIKAYKTKEAAEKARLRIERRHYNLPKNYKAGEIESRVFYKLLPDYLLEGDTYYMIEELELC